MLSVGHVTRHARRSLRLNGSNIWHKQNRQYYYFWPSDTGLIRCTRRLSVARTLDSGRQQTQPQFPTSINEETIYALSTAQGKAGIAVIRISGKHAIKAVKAMASPSKADVILSNPHRLTYTQLLHPNSQELLDRGMVVFAKGPHSFTGEDVVEFHIHGGVAIVNAIYNALGSLSFFRPAEAGEFTRRAFENDKLDLTSIEGLADMLNAETEAQRRLALRQAGGEVARGIEGWRKGLIKAMSLVEAVIDFGEDEGIEDGVLEDVHDRIQNTRSEVLAYLSDDRRGEILRNGITVAVFGPPNAGKSSFLNALTRRQAAIVSAIPGTTRDVIEVALDIGGYPIVIADTAGLRESKDEVENLGMDTARSRIASADMKICVLDGQDAVIDLAIYELLTDDVLILLNKSDLGDSKVHFTEHSFQWPISCKTHTGLERFLADFTNILKERFDSSPLQLPPITQARYRKHLQDCVQWLDEFSRIGKKKHLFLA